ncbi:MAG: DinB family protein [Calditrichaeota bacterium]|nr:DinB family protein [Calditrichota bacterium]
MIVLIASLFVFLTQGIRPISDDFATNYLEKSLKTVETSVQSLGRNQYEFRPAEGRWSIKDNVEHLLKVEHTVQDLVFNFLKEKVRSDFKSDKTDDEIIKIISVRQKNFNAPPQLQPKNEYKTLSEALLAYKEERQKTINLLQNTKTTLRQISGNNPVLGVIDGYQWFIFASAHTERHMEQINEIMNHQNFPKK